MAIVINGWRPDTCECEIHYSFDPDVPSEERDLSVHAVKTACPAHAHLDHPELFEIVLDENNNKNSALNVILDNFPNHTRETMDMCGNPVIAFLPGKEPIISFSEDRTIEMVVPCMTEQEKEEAQNLLDAAIGEDKVEVK